MNSCEDIDRKFREVFQTAAELRVRAPGRFNLIGEHTDYNLGWVMPGAIDRYIFMALGKGACAEEVEVFAADLQEKIKFRISEVGDVHGNAWQHYVRAVVAVLQGAGFSIPGFRVAFGGNIPIGAGLSSSAALCCGLISALSAWQGWEIPLPRVATLAQSAEHLVGLQCGLMDQYAVLFGKAGHLLHLDCRSLEFQYLNVDWGKGSLLLFDSGVKHALAAESGYNDRRASCERVVAMLRKRWPDVNSLRDIHSEMLSTLTESIHPADFRRASYVLEENHRVGLAVKAIQAGDTASLGQLLWDSHQGLRYGYEVTCPETDLLADLAMAHPGVWGARQVGGGFGGCVLIFADSEQKDNIISTLSEKYSQKTQIFPTAYSFKVSNGILVEDVLPLD